MTAAPPDAGPFASGTRTGHAWRRLATDPQARRLSAIRKLVYLAVAHHHDQLAAAADPAAAATSVARWTGLPLTAVGPALSALTAAGWLDGDDRGGYKLPADAMLGDPQVPAMLDYIAIDTDGCIRLVSVALPAADPLAVLQSAVCGPLQLVPVDDTLDGYVNEEGRRLGMAPNEIGGLVHQHLTGCPQPWPLVGPLLFVGCAAGEQVSITAEQRRRIAQAWAAVTYR